MSVNVPTWNEDLLTFARLVVEFRTFLGGFYEPSQRKLLSSEDLFSRLISTLKPQKKVYGIASKGFSY